MKEYLVIVKLMSEAISLGAEDDNSALERARQIIAEEYSESVAKDASYEVREAVK